MTVLGLLKVTWRFITYLYVQWGFKLENSFVKLKAWHGPLIHTLVEAISLTKQIKFQTMGEKGSFKSLDYHTTRFTWAIYED